MEQVTETWSIWRSGPGLAAENMAADEALLDSVSRLGQPVLRFYSWAELAATFGYFQRHSEIAGMTKLRPLVRRPTGGGLVPHDHDWTYSLVFPPGHPWYETRAVESYSRLHEWLRRALAALAVSTRLAPEVRPEGPGQCFIGAEKNDLLWQDQKIAGAAQRRNKLGLLIQGSVHPPGKVARADWESAMQSIAQKEWNVKWK
ncbi:MAG TPA: hypothetical protein VHH73_20440, partial [Verrucomicrobiae bacterium]|nr:hypothetical protein [Verrucomicrobiae bacterium]